VRPAEGRDPAHTPVLDAQLLGEESELLPETVALGMEPDPGIGAVDGPGAREGERGLGERDDLEDNRSDVIGPGSREGQCHCGASGSSLPEHDGWNRRRRPRRTAWHLSCVTTTWRTSARPG